MAKLVFPEAPATFETADQFTTYFDKLVKLRSDPRLAGVPAKERSRYFQRQAGVLMAGWKTGIRALWGHKELLEGKPGKAIQASSARYFASITNSFKKSEMAINGIIAKESVDEADIPKLKAEFLNLLSLFEELEIPAGRPNAAQLKKDLPALVAAVEKEDDKTLARLLKQKLSALPKAAQKQLDALMKRFGAITELPGPSTEANVAVDAIIVILAFIFGTLFLGLALYFILNGIYEWSWEASLPIYDFFRFLRLFPESPPPAAGPVDIGYMMDVSKLISAVIVIGFLIRWLRRKAKQKLKK